MLTLPLMSPTSSIQSTDEDEICIICLMPIHHDYLSRNATPSIMSASHDDLLTMEEGIFNTSTSSTNTVANQNYTPHPHKTVSQITPIRPCSCQLSTHPKCFHEWCLRNPICPICRTPIENAAEYARLRAPVSLNESSSTRSPTISVSCKVLMGIVFFGWVMMRVLAAESYSDEPSILPNQSNVAFTHNDTIESEFTWILPISL